MVSLKNVSPPSDGIRHEQAEITAVWNGEGLGPGHLYVAETRVSWFDGSGMGFSLEYPSISLHAISRDLTAYPKEHLYVMVNSKHNDNCVDEDDDEESGDDDCDTDSISPFTEIRFVPSDKASLEPIFSAMSECQALHPDPEDTDSDFDEDEYDVEEAEQGRIDLPTFSNFEEGLSQLTVEGQATLGRLDGMLADSAAQQQQCITRARPEDTTEGCCIGTELPDLDAKEKGILKSSSKSIGVEGTQSMEHLVFLGRLKALKSTIDGTERPLLAPPNQKHFEN